MKVAERLDSLLQGNRLVKSERAMMSGMSCPQELNVSGLRLDSVADSTFSRLKSLRVLDLRGNNLKQLGHSAVAGPPSLREVYLSGKLISVFATDPYP
jgi:Leucine-rich repeat (LRR) protein